MCLCVLCAECLIRESEKRALISCNNNIISNYTTTRYGIVKKFYLKLVIITFDLNLGHVYERSGKRKRNKMCGTKLISFKLRSLPTNERLRTICFTFYKKWIFLRRRYTSTGGLLPNLFTTCCSDRCMCVCERELWVRFWLCLSAALPCRCGMQFAVTAKSEGETNQMTNFLFVLLIFL